MIAAFPVFQVSCGHSGLQLAFRAATPTLYPQPRQATL
jgi:hypothetical protein